MTTTRNSRFSWEVNGVNVSQLGDRYSVETIQPNQSILNISRLEVSDLGQIRCTGEDPIHIRVTAEASVVETEGLYIVGQLQGEGGGGVNVSIQIGTNLELNCTVRNHGMDVPNIRWFLGHRELKNGPEFSIDSSGTLRKNNVSLSNEAEYSCLAEVGATSLELAVNVKITSKL